MFREGVIKNGMCNIVQSAGEFHPLPNHNTLLKSYTNTNRGFTTCKGLLLHTQRVGTNYNINMMDLFMIVEFTLAHPL
jgi:hypothetical protein